MSSFKRLYQPPRMALYSLSSCAGVLRVLGCLFLRKHFGLVVKYDDFGVPLYFYKW